MLFGLNRESYLSKTRAKKKNEKKNEKKKRKETGKGKDVFAASDFLGCIRMIL